MAPFRGRAITLWPEWAWAVMYLDKTVENRTWQPSLDLVGERLALHAGASVGGRPTRRAREDGLDLLRDSARRMGWSLEWQRREVDDGIDLQAEREGVVVRAPLWRRALVGTFVLGTPWWHDADERPPLAGWRVGPCCLPLLERQAFEQPIQGVSGLQRIWTLSAEHRQAVSRRLGQAHAA